jgi:hypothetical protein
MYSIKDHSLVEELRKVYVTVSINRRIMIQYKLFKYHGCGLLVQPSTLKIEAILSPEM